VRMWIGLTVSELCPGTTVKESSGYRHFTKEVRYHKFL
jgi:hypothetical protein